jgi:hypothetical protein
VECTGTLIAPRVFLTAEHCDKVWTGSSFDRQKTTTYWGSWHGDPAYSKSQSDPHDVAVVVLDTDVADAESITSARLPAAGSRRSRNVDYRLDTRSARDSSGSTSRCRSGSVTEGPQPRALRRDLTGAVGSSVRPCLGRAAPAVLP